MAVLLMGKQRTQFVLLIFLLQSISVPIKQILLVLMLLGELACFRFYYYLGCSTRAKINAQNTDVEVFFSAIIEIRAKKTHQNIIHLFLYSKTRLVIPKIFITDSTSSISRNGNGTISCSLFQLYLVSSWHTSMKLHRLGNIHNYKSQ